MPNTTESSNEISPAVSQRICGHMNDDHKISIYAMAKAALKSSSEKKKKLTNPKMKSISLSGYELSVVLCSGDVCEMKNLSIPFIPPLESPREAKERIIQDHIKAFKPHFSWLVTEPLTLAVFLIWTFWAYAALVLKEDGIVSLLSNSPTIFQNIVDKCFCCWYTFASFVIKIWHFGNAIHVLESVVAAYQCRSQLKLSKSTILKWFLLGCCVGFPVNGKVYHFAAMDKTFKKEKSVKKVE